MRRLLAALLLLAVATPLEGGTVSKGRHGGIPVLTPVPPGGGGGGGGGIPQPTCDYYAENNGGGTGLSQGSPFTIQAFELLPQATIQGKTLCLLDGTYTGAANMISPGTVAPGKNGTAAAPITIAALNDGAVTINGQFARVPVQFANNDYWTVTGINAHSSNFPALYIHTGSTHITIRRSVFWDGPLDQNLSLLAIHDSGTADILLEDVAAFGGIGRKMFAPTQGPTRVTCRRCYLRHGGGTYGGENDGNIAYGSFNITIENSVLTWNNETMPQSYTSVETNTPRTNFQTQDHQTILSHGTTGTAGLSVFARVLGSIIFIPATLVHPMVTSSFQGMYLLGADIRDVITRDVIVAIHPSNAAFTGVKAIRSALANDGPTISFTNITTLGGLANNFTTNQAKTNLVQSTSQFLVGGIPAVFTGSSNPWTGTAGAQICKRYENGTLTATNLWPWPMNDRIKAATAGAGAHTGPCSINCVGGRLARTEVDVTADIEAMFGAIPADCRS